MSVVGRQSTPQVDFSDNPMSQPSFEFYDARLLEQVRQGDPHVHQFFRLLAICHTVMPEEKDGTSAACRDVYDLLAVESGTASRQ